MLGRGRARNTAGLVSPSGDTSLPAHVRGAAPVTLQYRDKARV